MNFHFVSNLFSRSSSTENLSSTNKLPKSESGAEKTDSQSRIEKSRSFIDLSKAKTWASSLLLSDKEIKWMDENENSILIKISELAKKLGISKSEILKYVKKDEIGKLKELERLAVDFGLSFRELVDARKLIVEEHGEDAFDDYVASQLAAKLNVSPSDVLKYVKDKKLKFFKSLHLYAKQENIPLKDLLERKYEWIDENKIPIRINIPDLAEKLDLTVRSVSEYVNKEDGINKLQALVNLAKIWNLNLRNLTARAKDLSTEEFNKFLNNAREIPWFDDKGEMISYKIPDLAKKLGISEADIVKCAERKEINKLQELDQQAKKLNLSFAELFHANEAGPEALKAYLEKAEKPDYINSEGKIKWLDEEGKPILITTLDLAKKCGISESDLLRYVKSGQISVLKSLMSLAKVWNLSLSEVLKHNDKGSENLKSYLEIARKENYINSEGKIKWFNENKEPILIKTKDLADELGIPESDILKYINKGEIKKLKDLKLLADTLNVPFQELLKHSEAGQKDFENYLGTVAADAAKWNEAVDAFCKEAFERLDTFIAEIGESLMTKMEDGSFTPLMPKANETQGARLKKLQEEIELIKRVIKIQYRAFGKNPPKSELVISISEKYKIIIKPSGSTISITGLFGKLLGKGALGVAFHAVDLLTGTLATGEEAVLKQPISAGSEVAGADIVREYTSLKKIHSDGTVLGIQKPVKLVTDFRNGEVSYSHLGSLYETDMQQTIEPKPGKEKRILTPEDRFSLTYQFLHGVSHMHKKGITNGDIKPGNIFCNFSITNPQTGPLLYVADFGGSIDHSLDNSVELETTGTPEFRLMEDAEAANEAREAGNKDLYMRIEKKADVFATCSVICSFFTNEQPYDGVPGEGTSVIKANLKEKLIEKGLSPGTADLLIKGLSKDYNERPDAEVLFNAIKSELEGNVTPERRAFLEGRSLPL